MNSTMDHEQAVRMHAAERYLLEELSPEERDDFEAHYFMCTECASEVRAVFAFADNAAAVMVNEPYPAVARAAESARRSASTGWWAWLKPAFAMPALAALLLVVTAYQSYRVIGLQRRLDTVTAPRAIPSTVARSASRGAETVVQLSADDQFVQVLLDIDTTVPVSSYVCEIYDESGVLRFAVPAPAPTGGSLNLLLPAPGLKPGRYSIKVRSGSGSTSETADNYSFVVQRK